MLKKATSGQYLYFSLVGTFTGNLITGASGLVSGVKAVDGGAVALLSGNIVEDGGGLYHANLYDWDTSGNNIGYQFTCSGCAATTFSIVTVGGISGSLYPASGVNVSVPISSISGNNAVVLPANLSGVNAIVGSGLVVSVPLSTLSGIQPISGTFVSVPLSTLSGIQPASGSFVSVPLSTLSGIQPISGTSVSVPISSISGVNVAVSLASLSGVNAVVPLSTLSGIQPISGTFVSVPTASISGVNTNVSPAGLSGLVPSIPVGSISGVNAVVPIASISGVIAVVPSATILSGTLYLASGWPQAFLTYDFTGVPNSPVHTMVNANRKLTNKWDLSSNSGFLTVYLEDGTTPAYMQALTSQSGVAPVVALGDS